MVLAPRLKIEHHSFIACDYDILPMNISRAQTCIEGSQRVNKLTEVTQKAPREQRCAAVTRDFVLENSPTQNSRESASLENSKYYSTKMSFIYKLSPQTWKRIHVLWLKGTSVMFRRSGHLPDIQANALFLLTQQNTWIMCTKNVCLKR